MYLHCRSSPHEEESADLRREFDTILRSPRGKTRINAGRIRGEGSGSIKEKLQPSHREWEGGDSVTGGI